MGTLAVAVFGFGCADPQPAPRHLGRASSPILDGEPAPGLGAVVALSHRDSDRVCSGVLVAPSQVLTALHCAAFETQGDAGALPAEGFRVTFVAVTTTTGVKVEAERGVVELGWPGSGDDTLLDAVNAGRDVALLTLSEPAPAAIAPLALRTGYAPRTGDRLRLAGFGLVDTVSGRHGERLVATAEATAFDPERGTLQLEGAAACLGDSGGPLLFGPRDTVVGVIGQVGVHPDAGICATGLTFATLLGQPQVQDWLAASCLPTAVCDPSMGDASARLPDAGAALPEPSTPEVVDANVSVPPSHATDAAPPPMSGNDTTPDASTDKRGRGHGGCTTGPMHTPRQGPATASTLLLLMAVLRRRRARKT